MVPSIPVKRKKIIGEKKRKNRQRQLRRAPWILSTTKEKNKNERDLPQATKIFKA